MFRARSYKGEKEMDEEQGHQGSAGNRDRRSSLTTPTPPPATSSSFWEFASIRSLLSFRPSAPVTPASQTPEIIVTTCSVETIVSGGSGTQGPLPQPPNPPLSLTKSASTSSLEDIRESNGKNKSPSGGNVTEENKSFQDDGGDRATSPLLSVPSSSDDSTSVSSLSRSQDITVMEAPLSPTRIPSKKRRQSEPTAAVEQAATKNDRPSSPGGVLLNPLLLFQSKTVGNTLRLPKTFRKRSSSYSDLSSRKTLDPISGGASQLPELTANELRLILIKNLKKTDQGEGNSSERKLSEADQSQYISQLNEILRLPDHSHHHPHYRRNSKDKKKSNSEEMMDCCASSSISFMSPSSCGAAVAVAGLGAIGTGLFPAATSVASLLDNRMLGRLNNLQIPIGSRATTEDHETNSGHSMINSGGNAPTSLFNNATCSLPRQMRSRPRLLSHPEFSLPDTMQTAPAFSSAKRFLIPPYFRRPSQLSTQGLLLTESMVSLTNRALISFINDDNYSGLQHLLDNRRVAVDDRDEAGGTALMVAAAKGKANFVRLLLEHGADINSEDADNWTALHFAAKEGHDEIVSNLLDHGALVDKTEMGGWTPLIWTCYKGRTKAAKLLIEKNADVNAYGNFHVTCLAWSCGRGHAEIVRELLLHGARVNSGDKYGTTPLIWAARKGYIEIVDTLLSYEANVDACGMTSWTPLLVATAGNHVEVVKALLEHKPNINALDKDGCSALTIACKEGFHEIAICLISHGAYININDRGGTSNLIHAAKGGHRSIVESLLKRHADVNFQGKDRKTALYWAVEKNHVSVAKLLLAGNPDLELATKDGDTPLMKAVRNRNVEIVSLLLDKRAKVGTADKNGDTCLHIAMRARSKQIVELILRNPINSQLLYRPNRAGETPYNIDRAAPKPIMTQIFGSRGLNTQEDGENLLGYNLYSSALADMLSDPTLNTPITVGLFARWGSGKSFLLSKLREEMKSFARQWLNPSFTYDFLILIIIICFAAVLGVVGGLALHSWIVGLAFGGGFTLAAHVALLSIWFTSRRSKYEYSLSNKASSALATKMESLRVISQVIFCHPPGSQSSDQIQAQPINFYFTEQTKISTTTGGENSVVQMLGSLYACIENDYGVMSTRLYRAFRPRPVNATSGWKWRKLCCIPYFVIFLMCFVCTLVWIVVLAMYLTSMGADAYSMEPLTLQIIFYTCAFTVGMFLVANMYTIGRVLKAIVLSHRRHLQRTVSKLDAVKAEGFLQALKAEVNLMTNMVKCLDAFTGKQSRLVVIVDGLDSGEQEKVLQVLDAVHILFSDPKAPFIILLAVDPHIIAKGIELNINPVLNESNIGGHDYLRNLVHLPFFLQNAALRKVKHVKMVESSMKRNSRLFDEDMGPGMMMSARRPSVESGFQLQMDRFDKQSSKKTKKLGLKMSESIASSLGSNLNRVTSNINMPMGGPSDLKKMLLGDDYFSDVNPRSMRRLMNIIHITGRLLKSFSIDFNWYHLSGWVHLTEQWPYRLSWVIIYCEQFQKDLDEATSLKAIYEKVRPFIPTSKDIDSNVVLDRDEKKLDVYLGLHKGSLMISSMYVFLPFTISLDPQLRKDITEQYQPIEQIFKMNPPTVPAPTLPPATSSFIPQQPYTNTTSTQQVRLRASGRFTLNQPTTVNTYQGQLWNNGIGYNGNYWGPNGQGPPSLPYQYPQAPPALMNTPPTEPPMNVDSALVREFKNKKLSTMNVEAICDLLVCLTGIKSSQVTKYQDTVRKNNVCGRVLMSCDLADLKLVLQMTFGDWELFKSAIQALREMERGTLVISSPVEEKESKNVPTSAAKIPRNSSGKDLVKISVTSPQSPPERPVSKSPNVLVEHHQNEPAPQGIETRRKSHQQAQQLIRPNVLEKQVTMEEQMICGALELLNEEAKEDALKGEESSETTLSPINSEPESYPEHHHRDIRKSSKAYLAQDETDILYVMGTALNVTAELPDSPSIVRKLEEAEARYSVINESNQNYGSVLRNVSSTSAISDPVSNLPSTSAAAVRKGSCHPSITPNYSFSGTTMISTAYPLKSKSFGAKDFKGQHHPKGGKDSPRKGSRKSVTHQLPLGESSSDASSDESQKPLVMKPLGADAKQSRKGSHRPPRQDRTSPQRKHVSREESMGSRLSKLKSSLFGGSSRDASISHQSQQRPSPLPPESYSPPLSSSSSQQIQKRSKRPPVRYDLPTEDSEPSMYFREHGHPWKAVRAPTPLPPFGTDAYYSVIKSNNPSPTTSNESELGSTPDDISSKEEIYLSENPDRDHENNQSIPMTRFSQISSETNSNVVPGTITSKEATGPSTTSTICATSVVTNVIKNPLSSFVPISASSSKAKHSPSYLTRPRPKKLKDRAATSSGEEAIFVPLTNLAKTPMNQSDPGMLSSSPVGAAVLSALRAESQTRDEFVGPPSKEALMQEEFQSGSAAKHFDESHGSFERDPLISTASLMRQSAFDPGSSRENTPQRNSEK